MQFGCRIQCVGWATGGLEIASPFAEKAINANGRKPLATTSLGSPGAAPGERAVYTPSRSFSSWAVGIVC